jgi:penicillin-insensitive murein endopeptidase
MPPLKDGRTMPSHPFNRFGYNERFDGKGAGDTGQIDFDAMAAHLLALNRQSIRRGFSIRKVILAPNLQDDLFRADGGKEVRASMRFNRLPVWVRHDNYYHVDFAISCR